MELTRVDSIYGKAFSHFRGAKSFASPPQPFGRTGELVLFPSWFRVCRQASQRSQTLRVVSESFFSLSLERLRSAGETGHRCRYARVSYLCSTDPKRFASPRSTNGPGRAGRTFNGAEMEDEATDVSQNENPYVPVLDFVPEQCAIVHSQRFVLQQTMPATQRARRAKHSRAVDQRSVGRSVADSSRAESSARSETLRVGSESFFSLSLEHQRSAGEMARRCRYAVPSVLDRHQKFCESAARLDGYVEFKWRSNGERATDKALWTH